MFGKLSRALKRKAAIFVIRRIAGDLKRGEYGDMAKTIWAWLDGKKTAIGLSLVALPQLGDAGAQVFSALAGFAEAFRPIFSAFSGGDSASVSGVVAAFITAGALFTKGVGWIATFVGAAHQIWKKL